MDRVEKSKEKYKPSLAEEPYRFLLHCFYGDGRLEEAASTVLRDVIETIQTEQYNVISSDYHTH